MKRTQTTMCVVALFLTGILLFANRVSGSWMHALPQKGRKPDRTKQNPLTSSRPAAPSPETRMEGAAGITLVSIPAGEFQMGSENGGSDEKPVHRVTISEPFWMGKYEVTQAQWESVMGSNPSKFRGQDLPVEEVSWDDCQEFIRKLNAKRDGNTYSLPTEAEWEYVCRAGTGSEYSGKNIDALRWHAGETNKDYAERNLDPAGWYEKNSGEVTHPVGQRQPNGWGLCDMHGNVREWCADWYDENYYKAIGTPNPQGAESGEYRVFRGGSWFDFADDCRSAARGKFAPTLRDSSIGFRVVAHSTRK